MVIGKKVKRSESQITIEMAFDLSQRIGLAMFKAGNEVDKDSLKPLLERAENLHNDLIAVLPQK